MSFMQKFFRYVSTQDKRTLFLILALSFLIRLIHINMPILEGTLQRQIQTASISRYFFTEGFNFYPKLDFLIGTTGYLVMEFPLFNIILASLYKLFGGVHEWLGRVLSILFFMGSGLFVFQIIKRLYNLKIARIGLIAFLVSPLGIIFSRAIMPDSEMLFFCTGSIFFLLYFVQTNKDYSFWLSSVFTMLALLVKPHSFHIAIPLFYLIFYRERLKLFTNYRNYLYLLIVLTPAILWYLHGISAHKTFAGYRILNFQLSNWFQPQLFLSPPMYKDLLRISSGILLTPVGFLLFLFGLGIRMERRLENVCYFWLAGIALYACMFNALLWEAYYYLPFLPIASIFIARAFLLIQDSDILRKTYLYKKVGLTIAIVILFLMVSRFAIYAYVIPKGYRYIQEAAVALKSLSVPDDKVIIADNPGSSALLYYSQRKGWFLTQLKEDDSAKQSVIIKALEDMRDKGAKYFLSTDTEGLSRNFLSRYLNKKYTLLEHKKSRYIVYSLR